MACKRTRLPSASKKRVSRTSPVNSHESGSPHASPASVTAPEKVSRSCVGGSAAAGSAVKVNRVVAPAAQSSLRMLRENIAFLLAVTTVDEIFNPDKEYVELIRGPVTCHRDH